MIGQTGTARHRRFDGAGVRHRHRRPRAILSGQADQDDRAVPAGRADRHHGAAHRPGHLGAARPAGDRREPPRRGLHHRLQGRRRGRTRRLYAACSARPARSASRPRSIRASTSIRSSISPRSRPPRCCRTSWWSGPSVPAKTVAEFVAYAKANPGQAQLRRRPRHAAASAHRRCSRPRPGSTSPTSPTRARRRR